MRVTASAASAGVRVCQKNFSVLRPTTAMPRLLNWSATATSSPAQPPSPVRTIAMRSANAPWAGTSINGRSAISPGSGFATALGAVNHAKPRFNSVPASRGGERHDGGSGSERHSDSTTKSAPSTRAPSANGKGSQRFGNVLTGVRRNLSLPSATDSSPASPLHTGFGKRSEKSQPRVIRPLNVPFGACASTA